MQGGGSHLLHCAQVVAKRLLVYGHDPIIAWRDQVMCCLSSKDHRQDKVFGVFWASNPHYESTIFVPPNTKQSCHMVHNVSNRLADTDVYRCRATEQQGVVGGVLRVKAATLTVGLRFIHHSVKPFRRLQTRVSEDMSHGCGPSGLH